MPYHGAKQVLRASNGNDVAIVAPFVHATAWFVVLVALTTWRSPIAAASTAPTAPDRTTESTAPQLPPFAER